MTRGRKGELLAMMGSKCEVCGLEVSKDNPECCFDFHHKDIRDKKFTLGRHWGHTPEEVKEEVRKCRILCSLCHRKEHYKVVS